MIEITDRQGLYVGKEIAAQLPQGGLGDFSHNPSCNQLKEVVEEIDRNHQQ